MSNRRLFVAIELPEPVRRELAAIAPTAPGVRATKAYKLHLTLHFIGDASVARLKRQLLPISQLVAPFTLRLSSVGHFSSRSKSVVFWVGVELSAELTRLYTEVGRLLSAAGLSIETRAYSPHI